MVVYSIANRVTDFDYLWKFFLLPALFLSSIAALSTLLSKLFKVRRGLNWIFLLFAVGIDQSIKAFLFSKEWETISITLVEPVFYIEPTQNTLGSYLWVLLRLKEGSHVLNIILFSIIGLVFLEIWRFYVRRKRNSFWINGFIHLFLAGLFANLIDNRLLKRVLNMPKDDSKRLNRDFIGFVKKDLRSLIKREKVNKEKD